MTEFDASVRPSMQRLAKEIQLHKKMVDNGILASCLGCEHWSGNKTATCQLHKATPPLDVIVFGCTDYLWGIPF